MIGITHSGALIGGDGNMVQTTSIDRHLTPSIRERLDGWLEEVGPILDYRYITSLSNSVSTFTTASKSLFDPVAWGQSLLRLSKNANDAFQVASGISNFEKAFLLSQRLVG